MGKKLLLADDDSDLRFLTEMTLSEAGYDVVTATNGQEALALAQADNFDVILLDAMMPVMNGYEAFVQLRAQPRTAAIPVIFLTAQTPDEKTRKKLGLPVVDFILKPFDADALSRQIETILNETQMRGDVK